MARRASQHTELKSDRILERNSSPIAASAEREMSQHVVSRNQGAATKTLDVKNNDGIIGAAHEINNFIREDQDYLRAQISETPNVQSP